MDVIFGAIGLLSGVVLGAAFVGGSLVLSSLLLFVPGMLWAHPISFLNVSVMVGTETVIAAGTAAWTHRPLIRGEVVWPLMLPAAVMGVAGAMAVRTLPVWVILVLLELVIVLSVYRLAGHRTVAEGSANHRPQWHLWVAGAGVGVLSGLYGIGGGFLMVPLLIMRGLPVRTAVGNALAVGASIALVGLVVKLPYVSLAHFPLVPLLLVVLGASVGAQIGSLLARRVPDLWMRRVVMGLLTLIAIKVGVSAWDQAR